MNGWGLVQDGRTRAAVQDERKKYGRLSQASTYTANLPPFGRALPPCTDGSAHHFSASRRTP